MRARRCEVRRWAPGSNKGSLEWPRRGEGRVDSDEAATSERTSIPWNMANTR